MALRAIHGLPDPAAWQQETSPNTLLQEPKLDTPPNGEEHSGTAWLQPKAHPSVRSTNSVLILAGRDKFITQIISKINPV